MKLCMFFVALMLCSFSTYSQSNFSKFKKLSSPKKWWVCFHPFKAKRALNISNEVIKVTDSVYKSLIIGDDISGGKIDAFRHAFWMAKLRQSIGKRAARSLGRAHEKENYQYFLENKLEDGTLPDKASMDMDLYNNEVGLSLVLRREKTSKLTVINRVIFAIEEGMMLVIKKDSSKRYLSCKNLVLSRESLNRNWLNQKCLIPSN